MSTKKTDLITSIQAELADVPWSSETKLALIAQKIRESNSKTIPDSQIMEAILLAASLQLNPLEGQIAFIMRGSQLVPTVQIKGMLSIAHRTGEFTGCESFAQFDENGKIKGAITRIGRNGHEYVGKKYSPVYPKAAGGDYTPTDATINASLRVALRLAFPEFLGSVYGDEDFASNGGETVVATQSKRPKPSITAHDLKASGDIADGKPAKKAEPAAIEATPTNGNGKKPLTADQKRELGEIFATVYEKDMPGAADMTDGERQFCEQTAGELRAFEKNKAKG